MSEKNRISATPSHPTAAGKKLVFASIAVVGFFVVLELVLAVVGVRPGGTEDPYVGFDAYVPLFELDDTSQEMRTAPAKLEWFNPQRFERSKPPETFRIFALGGSTTYGRPYDHHVSFPKWIELLLNEMDPAHAYEVVNAGGISYASYRLVVVMREIVAYEPDLIIIYTGHNEFLEERTYRDIIDDGPALRVLTRGASRLRTAALLERVLRPEPERDQLPAEVQAKLDVWSGLDAFTRDDALREAVVAHFRFNVRQLIAIAREHDVPLVFVEPSSNLKDFSPFKSEHDASVTRESLTRFDQLYEQATRRPAGDGCAETLAALREALELSPEFADVHYRMGRCELAGGGLERAHEHLMRAKELDVAPLRALEAAGEVLRDEAETDDNAMLVEARTLLERDSRVRYGHAILGNEYFLDHVHPRVELHQRIAEWIVDELVARRIVSSSVDLSDTRRRSLYTEYLDTLDAAYYARRDLNLGKVLGWAEKNAEAAAAFERARMVMPNDPDLLRNLGIVYQKERRFDEAIARYAELVVLRPADPEIHFNLGKCYQGLAKWNEAESAFARALELAPGDAKSHYNLALVLRALGRAGEELLALEAAWKADPDLPGIAGLIGSVYAREGRYDDAIGAFVRALELAPDAGGVHYHLASVYAARGQADEAVEHFRRAKELGIDVPDVVFAELSQ